MTAANQQIVTAYDTLGMSPEEIAEQNEMELAAVKAILMQFSSVFRKNVRKGDESDFSDAEAEEAKMALVNTMRYTEDDNLKVKIAMYLRDDKKGRLDAAKKVPGLTINVLTFNEQLKKAREAMTIDVEEVKLVGA